MDFAFSENTKQGKEIHAVIGVEHKGALTHYFKRSMEMGNYPGVWSLPSIKFMPEEFTDHQNLETATSLFEKLSLERFGGVPIKVQRYLTSGSSDKNPMGVMVTLHLYEISLEKAPALNPRYYSEAAWMKPEEYEQASVGQACGLCLRLWSDYAWMEGLTPRPFAPSPK